MTDTPATTPEPEAEPERVLMVYAGERLGEKNKAAHEWYPVQSDGTLASTNRWYEGNLVRGAYVGAAYLFHQPAGTTKIYTAGSWAPVYQNPWPNREDVLRWQVASRDAEAQRAAKRDKDKDAKGMDVIRATLLPLRRLYYGRPPISRQAVLELVLAELSRPLTKAERGGGNYDPD